MFLSCTPYSQVQDWKQQSTISVDTRILFYFSFYYSKLVFPELPNQEYLRIHFATREHLKSIFD